MWDFHSLHEEGRREFRLKRRLIALSLLVLALVALGGCNLSGVVQSWKDNQTPTKSVDLPELLPEAVPEAPKLPEKVKVALYFKDQQGRYLVAEKQEIGKVPGIARAALSALCQGPGGGSCQPSLPAGAGVRDLNIKTDGLCVVDLNQATTGINDPKSEALAVYAVVNTLTEFPAVKKVQILVGGQKRKTLAGHIPIDEPLLRNLSFVKS